MIARPKLQMFFWKVFVVVDLLIAAGYWWAVWKGKQRPHAFDIVSIPVGVLGSLGLIMYAFSLPTPSQLIWRAFLPIFIASSAWEIATAVKNEGISAEAVFGVAPALLLVGFTSVALYRLGGSHWVGLAGL